MNSHVGSLCFRNGASSSIESDLAVASINFVSSTSPPLTRFKTLIMLTHGPAQPAYTSMTVLQTIRFKIYYGAI